MPKVLQIALCQHATVDQLTNAVTLVGLVEQLGVPSEAFVRAKSEKVAAGPLTLFALFSWQWPAQEEPAIIDVKLRVRSPQGRKYMLQELHVNAPSPMPRCRLIVQMQGFPIDGPGLYVFELVRAQKVMAAVPLLIDSVDVSAKPMAAGAATTGSTQVKPAVARSSSKRRPTRSK